ncbi:MAG TPA: ABC transporter ATP-binding protein, partial [Gammaproteobacteria bacterium]|nr:ABC transporter ATP-binding protein [Gammaproteobacteria bacterium]
MANIVFKNVAKRFGEVSVIEKFDLEVRDHEFMVFVGPSGCGKSTALRMIAGLEEVSEGELYIGDRMVNNVHPKDRDVAMVFQSYALYPHMTVRQNIEVPLKTRAYAGDGDEPRKLHKPERAERVQEAARILGLSDL